MGGVDLGDAAAAVVGVFVDRSNTSFSVGLVFSAPFPHLLLAPPLLAPLPPLLALPLPLPLPSFDSQEPEAEADTDACLRL